MKNATLKQQALNDIRGGRLRPALQLLSEACESDQQDPEIWFYLGAVHGSLGDTSSAIKSFRAAIALRPDFAQARFNLGNALKEQGQLAEAAAEFRAVIKLAPEHAPAWCALAYTLTEQGAYPEAEISARRAVKLAPNSVEAYVALGSVHLAKTELTEAMRLFSEALNRDPNSISALVNLGLANKSTGRFSEAKALFNRAIAIQPRLPEAHYSLGLIFVHENNLDEAEAALYRAVDQQPRYVHAFAQLGALLRYRNKRMEALKLYRRFAREFPEHPDVRFFLPMLESGQDPGRIPVEILADQYRSNKVARLFDEGLTKQLAYTLPVRVKEHMVHMFRDKPTNIDALDLGCGTGLYGSVLRPWTRKLVGVDLSPVMLEEAKRKGAYDDLICGELIETLDKFSDRYDIVIAMDVLVFFGDLIPIFERVKKVLRPQGLFIFDLEKGDEAHRWQLHILGNYVHSRGYITELAERYGFEELLCEEQEIRKERSSQIKNVDSYIKGYLAFLRSKE